MGQYKPHVLQFVTVLN